MFRTTKFSTSQLAHIVAVDDDESSKEDEGYISPVLGLSIERVKTCGPLSPVFSMAEELQSPGSPKKHQIYKLVLTGGPCGGKTTGQDRLASFFENLGWKVFTVPETATVLLNGRVKFAELSTEQSFAFQTDLLRTMLQIENTFFNQAQLITDRNVLIICDRGAMDPSAYMSRDHWLETLRQLNIDEFELLNTRYNQVIHLVTAADGAEDYYTLGNNAARSEGLNLARDLDEKTRKVWIGHPYVDIVDNSECKKFEDKVLKMVQVVCDRTGIETKDRLSKNSKKRKWLVVGVDEEKFAKFNQFIMRHDYLLSDTPEVQVRIRSRSQGGRVSYSLTTRQYHSETRECVETRTQISEREYRRYLAMRDNSRDPLFKLRRAFMVGNQYFNLDTYTLIPPGLSTPVGNDMKLMFLETYTTRAVGDHLPDMPPFLSIKKEITGDSRYSMYLLSCKPGVESDGIPFVGAAEYKDD